MAVTTTSDTQAKAFIEQLQRANGQFQFKEGKQDHWSPGSNTITYNPHRPLQQFKYSLLHELAHALLGHTNYTSDFELLKLESEAWQLAQSMGKDYEVDISEAHIQNCLDTYRDWLHRRSTCPTCGSHVLQSSAKKYTCFNCGKSWQVSSGRFARPYRRQT